MNTQLFDEIVSFRRDLHKYPELSWKEYKTSKKIYNKLTKWGIPCRVVAGTGIIAEIHGKNTKNKPFIALRADIDALPIYEETGLEFASQNEGVMHACAHDGHTSIILGAAKMLSQESDLILPIRLIFQPAEEEGAGSIAMIKENALDNVTAIFGGHIDRHYQTGEIVISEGAVNASTDTFTIEIEGMGGHGARPHESIDAVVVGSLIIIALQTIVSREINPAHPSVVSVGVFNAGTASNVISGRAKLEGTIRALEPSVRQHLQNAIRRISKSVGELHCAKVSVTIGEGTPPLINEENMTHLCRQAAKKVVSEQKIKKLHTVNMGGEDFSYYLDQIPGCYVRFGAQMEGKESFPAHSSKFDFDEKVLEIAANYFLSVAKTAGEEFSKKL